MLGNSNNHVHVIISKTKTVHFKNLKEQKFIKCKHFFRIK